MPDHLLELIRTGRLRAGTKLHHRSRRHAERNVEATVVSGGIKLRGRVFDSPSGAARFITGAPVDGWTFWRLPDGSYLNELRTP
jgi:hypothetical protein